MYDGYQWYVQDFKQGVLILLGAFEAMLTSGHVIVNAHA